METRANFVLVGAFTVAVIAGAFMFVLWFSGLGQVSDRKIYRVLFTGSVSGLSRGASVLFNGLRVGEVGQIDFLPNDPGHVAAFIHVESRVPINKDTTARLELQGLTGGAALALTGGAPDAAALVGENGAPPVIVAAPSQIQNLLENVQNISAKADAVLGKADKLLSDNTAAITDTLRNVDTFSKALGDSSAGVGGAVTGLSELGRKIGPLAERLETLTDHADKLVGAVNPDKVRQAVDDVATFTGALADGKGSIKSVLDDTAALAKHLNDSTNRLDAALADYDALAKSIDTKKVGAIVDGAQALSETLSQNKANIGRLLENAADLSVKLKGSTDRLDSALTDIDTVVKSVDPKKVASLVDGADALGQSLSQNKGNIDKLIKESSTLAGKLNGTTERLDGALSDFDGLVKAVNAKKVADVVDAAKDIAGQLKESSGRLNGALADVDTLVKSVDPKKVASLVDGADALGQSLSQNKGNIDSLIKDSSALAGRLNGTTERLDNALSDFDGLLKSVDTKKVADIVSGIQDLAGKLNATSGRLDTALSDVDTLVKSVDTKKVANIVDGADALGVTLSQNKGNIDKLLKDSADLAGQLKQSAARLDGALSNVDTIVKSVDAKKVATIVDGASTLGETLNQNKGNIDRLLKDSADLAGQLKVSSGHLDGALTDFDGLVKSVDTKKVATLVDGADALGESLRQNKGNIDRMLKDAAELAAKLDASADKIDGLMTSLQGFVGSPDVKGPLAQVGDAARSVRQLADDLNVRTKEISVGLTKFTGAGLREYEALAVDGRRTVNDFDRVLRGLERNPSQLIFGAKPNLPEYHGSP